MITHKDIEALFDRQLHQIEDARLRADVIECWVRGCNRGNWKSLDELWNMPFTLVTNPKGISFVEHTIAVTEGALGLARAQIQIYRNMPYRIRLDWVAAGAILHDVGKLLEIEPDGSGGYRRSRNGTCLRHPISGTVIAAEVGLPDELLNSIACHAKEGEGSPKTVETILIHQADYATFTPLVMQQKGDLIV